MVSLYDDGDVAHAVNAVNANFGHKAPKVQK